MTAPSAQQAHSRNLGYYAYLNQGQVWLPKDRPSLSIVDMDPAWRRNAAAWLVRRAPVFALYYSLGELERLGAPVYREAIGEQDGQPVYRGRALSELDLMSDAVADGFEEAVAEREQDPAAWIRTTPLYRALLAGLDTEAVAV